MQEEPRVKRVVLHHAKRAEETAPPIDDLERAGGVELQGHEHRRHAQREPPGAARRAVNDQEGNEHDGQHHDDVAMPEDLAAEKDDHAEGGRNGQVEEALPHAVQQGGRADQTRKHEQQRILHD